MLTELYNKKSDFRTMDMQKDLDKLYVTYMNKFDSSCPIDKTLTSLNNFSFFVEDTHQLTTASKYMK